MKKNKIGALLVVVAVLLAMGCEPIETDPGTDPWIEPDHVYIFSATATPTDSEQITLKNPTATTVDLTGWTLGDLNDPTAYNIPNGTLLTSGETKTYIRTTLGFQINDSGETLYLKNSSGTTIDTWNN